MSNSTPQGPGPEFGSNPDATPIDQQAALQQELDEEAAATPDDGAPIDISDNAGPELTADVDDVDAGSE